MKAYISGAISGVPDAAATFGKVARCLQGRGHETLNPFDITACAKEGICGVGTPYPHAWDCYLRHDIQGMLNCDAIAMIPGWENSTGARLELHVAASCGLQVWMLNELWQVSS